MRDRHFRSGEIVLTWADISDRSKKCAAIVLHMVRGYDPADNFYVLYMPDGAQASRYTYEVWEINS